MHQSPEIETRRIQNIAAAEKARLTIEAEGKAAAARAQGEAQAAITRLQRTAEADIILSKGEAEAKAMNVGGSVSGVDAGRCGRQTHHQHGGSGSRNGGAIIEGG